jgi:hypothetical protein
MTTVRVVLEGERITLGDGAFRVGELHGNIINPKAKHVVSIEEIVPPPQPFSCGDIVEWRGTDRHRTRYVLGDTGYLDDDGEFFRYSSTEVSGSGWFTSAYYKKIGNINDV